MNKDTDFSPMYQLFRYYAYAGKAQRKAVKNYYRKNKIKRNKQMKKEYYQNQLPHLLYVRFMTESGLIFNQRKAYREKLKKEWPHVKNMYSQLIYLADKKECL